MTPDEKIKMTLGDLMVRVAIAESQRDEMSTKVGTLEAENKRLTALLDKQGASIPDELKPLLGDNLHS